MTKEASLGRCPFCQKGIVKLHPHPLYVYWHKKTRGHKQHTLEAYECDHCGVVIFKRVKD